MDILLAKASWEDLYLDRKCDLLQSILVDANIGIYGGQCHVTKKCRKDRMLRRLREDRKRADKKKK